MHKVRTRRQLAYVAELWYARDQIAHDEDRAPGRILPDIAITELYRPPVAVVRRHPAEAVALELGRPVRVEDVAPPADRPLQPSRLVAHNL